MTIFPEPNALKSVAEFHNLFRAPIVDMPSIPSPDRCKLRVSLLEEEVGELKQAADDSDLVEIADALADIQYVLSGAVLEFGMGGIFKALFDDVQRSNMTKACATYEEAEETRAHYLKTKGNDSIIEKVDGLWLVYRKGDLKALKSIKYSPTNLSSIVKSQVSSTATNLMEQPACLESVAAFHKLFRCPVVEKPRMPDMDRCNLRVSLLEEEVKELKEAIEQDDLIEVADALADIQYVLSGAALEFGMGGIFKTLFDEVHRSNMSKACSSINEAEETSAHYLKTKGTDSVIEKVDGQWLVHRKSDRKCLKSVNYSPAGIRDILKIPAPSSPTSVKQQF